MGVINDKLAYKGYSYLLVTKGYGCLCSCVFDKTGTLPECFDASLKYFKDTYAIDIKNPKPVGGIGYFNVNNLFQNANSKFIGEAAGLQDFLAGFGMRTAFESGYLAAQAIIKNQDYHVLAEDAFRNHIKAGVVNRFLFERAAKHNYLPILEKMTKLNLSFNILRSVYNFNILERFEYNEALEYVEKTYPEIS